jgi:hypothetical protein
MILALLLAACGQPAHMQYDFGRAYADSLELQAQLDRPGAAAAQYALGGSEGLDVRMRAKEAATEKSTGTSSITAKVGK